MRAGFRLPAVALVAAISAAGHSGLQAALASGEIAIRVDDLVIDAREFDSIFRDAVRRKFYHGQVPAAELVRFREKVARDLVDQIMVHRDAERRGLEPDRVAIGLALEDYDRRYAAQSGWQSRREAVLDDLARRLERRDLLRQMELRIRQLPEPGEDRVRAFYRDNPGLFTEPGKLRASVILLPVSPSAGEPAWLQAEAQASRLKTRLDGGADFASLARQFSGHASASRGGDLGYLHRGMLEPGVQQAVDALQPGATTAPIRVLEGILLFRLDGVEPGYLQAFSVARTRAAGLLYRQLQDQAWREYLDGLAATANIHVDETLFVRSDHE